MGFYFLLFYAYNNETFEESIAKSLKIDQQYQQKTYQKSQFEIIYVLQIFHCPKTGECKMEFHNQINEISLAQHQVGFTSAFVQRLCTDQIMRQVNGILHSRLYSVSFEGHWGTKGLARLAK